MEMTEIYEAIKTAFTEKSGETVRDDGDLGIRMQVVAGELSELSRQVEFLEQQIFPHTASGEYLERHGACRNVLRRPAAGAVGKLSFECPSPAEEDIVIPAGTICTDSAGSGIMYATTIEDVLRQGSTNITVPARAEQIGPETNRKAGQIDTIVTSVPGISKVINHENFTGGCEAEAEEVYRRRLLASFLRIGNGANLKFYEDLALSCEGVWSAKAVVSSDGGTVTLYISDFNRTTPDVLKNTVQEKINAAKAVGTKITVEKAQYLTQAVEVEYYAPYHESALLLRQQIASYLSEKLLELQIGENVNPYLLFHDFKEEFPECTDLSFIEPFGMIEVKESQIAKPGEITVTLKSEV